ncbi:MAG: nuclear transport factor 2 family protein [Rhodanobacteraceae bacterium]|nr:nuclear transport factor 2 family protein [Rhodanobacteraceae bacterium]
MHGTCFHPLRRRYWIGGLLSLVALCVTAPIAASPPTDQAAVAALDTEFQAAVKRNDVSTVGRILADDFVLISGAGKVSTRQQLLDEVRSGRVRYEQQDEVPGSQTVRVWGDTAVVTALLWLKGVDGTQPFDRKLWFSDVYVRTPTGWKYALGQVGRMVEKDGLPVSAQ